MNNQIEWHKILHGKVLPRGTTYYLPTTGTFYVIRDDFVEITLNDKIIATYNGIAAKDWINEYLSYLTEIPKEYWRPVSRSELYKVLNLNSKVKINGVECKVIEGNGGFTIISIPAELYGKRRVHEEFEILEQTQFETNTEIEDMKKEFDINDLKTGMILVLRNGKRAMVLKDTNNGDIVSGDNFWKPISSMNKDLTSSFKSDGDVMFIEQPKSNSEYLYGGKIGDGKVIWQRIEESSEQKHLRELQEQYKILGEKIAQIKGE